MLPENKITRRDKRDYPSLPEPRTVRVRFRKVGNLQYISHLDLQRTFSRVLVRAGIPMWYTQGFNPHAKVIFALPLSVGAESECELIDLRIDRDMPCEEIRDRLNEQVTEDLRILEVYLPPQGSSFQNMAWAQYTLRIESDAVRSVRAEQVKAYLTTPPLLWTKKSKSGEREIDLTTMIRTPVVSKPEERTLEMEARLSIGGAEYLNPAYVIEALKQRFGLLGGNLQQECYSILRTQVYDADGLPFR